MLVWLVSMGLKVITLYVLSIILLVSGEEDAAEGGVSLVLQVYLSILKQEGNGPIDLRRSKGP